MLASIGVVALLYLAIGILVTLGLLIFDQDLRQEFSGHKTYENLGLVAVIVMVWPLAVYIYVKQ